MGVFMKNHTSFWYAVFFAAVFAFVPIGFSACETGTIAESEPIFPPVGERDPITEADIFGNYDGTVIPVMNGLEFGQVTEKIKIEKSSVTQKITFSTREQTPYHKLMRIGLSYVFNEITLVPAPDGKSFSFSGSGGELYMYASSSDTVGVPVSTKTLLKNGVICKKNGKVYIRYTVEYDVNDLQTRHLLPESHKTLASVMRIGIQQ